MTRLHGLNVDVLLQLPVTIGTAVELRTTHFSGTGPWLSSVDDFYAVSSESTNMVVMETSNTVSTCSVNLTVF